LAGGYFFLLADFLAAGFLAVVFCCFDFADLLAIMLLGFWSLTPLRHVSFPAEEPSMAAGAAAVNYRGEVSGAELCQKGLGFSQCLAALLPWSKRCQSSGHSNPVPSRSTCFVLRAGRATTAVAKGYVSIDLDALRWVRPVASR